MRFCICEDVHNRDKSEFKHSKTNLIYTIIDTNEHSDYAIKEFPFNSVPMLKRHLDKLKDSVEVFYYYNQKESAYKEYFWDDIKIPNFCMTK